MREDTDTVLGVVSDEYVVVQNRDCFAFLASLLGSELIFETAGSLWGGKQVFITARLPDHITVGGDEILPYVVLSAWHTGTGDPGHDHPGARGVRQHGARRARSGAVGVPRAPRRRPDRAAA